MKSSQNFLKKYECEFWILSEKCLEKFLGKILVKIIDGIWGVPEGILEGLAEKVPEEILKIIFGGTWADTNLI